MIANSRDLIGLLVVVCAGILHRTDLPGLVVPSECRVAWDDAAELAALCAVTANYSHCQLLLLISVEFRDKHILLRECLGIDTSRVDRNVLNDICGKSCINAVLRITNDA